MITNVDYLIQKYAEAREKINEANDNYGITYWRGVMDTYHNLLCNSFGNWAEYGTTGYYVFYELMSYDEALNAVMNSFKWPSEEGVLRDC